jgi:hypothetical protein
VLVEVEPKAKQQVVVLWGLQVWTKIVAGNISGGGSEE